MLNVKCGHILGLGLIAAGVLAGGRVARADFIPINIASSYNQDMVISASDSPNNTTGITASMDGGTAKSGYVWYQNGLTGGGSGGLSTGTVSSIAAGTPHQFQLPSAYDNGSGGTINDAILLDSGHTTVTLPVSTSTPYSAISFLNSTGSGTGSISFTITYADATTQTGSFSSPDWGTSGIGTVALNPGRVTPGATPGFQSNFRLYQSDITLTDTSSNVSSVALTYGGTGHTVVFALSGQQVPEPSSLGVLALASAGLLRRRRGAI